MQGAACGQCNLGIIYKDGIGVIKDYNKAFEWFEKAANQNDGEAQHYLGLLYLLGYGTEKDVHKGKVWLEKLCKNEYQKACDTLYKIQQ